MAIKVFLKIFAQHGKLVLYLELLKFVLKNNIFQFNGKIYHQICGIAMGTKLAPALAFVVVAHYEEEYLDTLSRTSSLEMLHWWYIGHIAIF